MNVVLFRTKWHTHVERMEFPCSPWSPPPPPPPPLQAIGYMENIDLPPTRLDVVQEPLRIAQRVAQECGYLYAIVSYDLAITKPALQIQAQ